MALLVSGVAYEHREIILRAKPASMLAASPKGTVPVLVLPDGRAIDESIDIMRWALACGDPEGWMDRADLHRIAAFDGAFKHHLDRYKYWTRHGVDPLVHRSAALEMLVEFDADQAGQDYLGGTTRGFTDIAIFPFVRQFAGVDPDWFEANAPDRVREWLAALTGSDLFDRAMARHSRWVPSSA